MMHLLLDRLAVRRMAARIEARHPELGVEDKVAIVHELAKTDRATADGLRKVWNVD